MAEQDDDDLLAFREAVQGAERLKPTPRVEHEPPRVEPVPVHTRRDERAVLEDSLTDPLEDDNAVDIGDELTYRRDGIPGQTLRKLRRGEWAVQDDLDLHSMTVDEARSMLAGFLSRCVRTGIRCVRVVHGKGYRSQGGRPVLKGKVAHWLRQRDEVLAYVQARPADGGSGALLVLLRGTPSPTPDRAFDDPD
ncbi:MAG: DNA mismatch repair protein MutS [Betaproteobacteria bacterium]|nr:DNA mismatch repair protein MutS [Betaproteobacteria bacterium]